MPQLLAIKDRLDAEPPGRIYQVSAGRNEPFPAFAKADLNFSICHIIRPSVSLREPAAARQKALFETRPAAPGSRNIHPTTEGYDASAESQICPPSDPEGFRCPAKRTR